jgi:hypothetical protein
MSTELPAGGGADRRGPVEGGLPQDMGSGQELSVPAALEAFGDVVIRLTERVAELEDSLSEAVETLSKDLGRVKKKLDELDDVVAKKKQLKKIQKILDQLEVVDEDDEDEEDDDLPEK